MGVNVGSFFAPLVCGYFGETGDPNDFKWGFLIAAIVTIFTVILFETQKNKYLIGPDGKPLGIIPDAKREQPKEHKTVQQTAIDKDKKMRNNLLLGALTIALALFFYWCFGNDWVSIGIFTACIVFPVSILLDGSLTKIERDRIFVIYIIAFFVIFFWGSLRTSRCFTHPLCCRTNRPYNPRLGNACLLDTIFQSVLRSYTGSSVCPL